MCGGRYYRCTEIEFSFIILLLVESVIFWHDRSLECSAVITNTVQTYRMDENAKHLVFTRLT